MTPPPPSPCSCISAAGSEVALALEDEQVRVLCRHLGFEVWWSC